MNSIDPSARVSYRGLLTRRFALLWAAAFVVIGLTLRIALGAVLLREVDRSLSLVASLQASAVAESPPERMELREWDVQEDEALQLRHILWRIQVWDEYDRVAVRSENLSGTLPGYQGDLDEVRRGGPTFQSNTGIAPPLRQVFYPLQRIDPRHEGHVIQVAVSLAPMERTLSRIDSLLILLGVTGVAIAALLSWSTASRALQPVETIVQQAASIEAPTEEARITAYAGTREFADLVRVLNAMLGRLQQAYEAQQRFTADASHELRSPLTAIRGTLEVGLRRSRSEEEYRRIMGDVLEEVDTMQALVNDLLVLARQDVGVLKLQEQSTSLDDLIGAAVDVIRPSAEAKDITLRVRAVGDEVKGDRGMLRRVLVNLLDNAVRYGPAGSEIEAGGELEGGRYRLWVEDQGPGVPERDRERIFERFYRADPARTAGEGSGLGLALSRAIVRAHGGRIRVEKGEDGARFVVELPV
ncbi:MAG: ATP-binding protein [bacterium]